MQLTLALLALVASVAAQTATIETASGKLPSNCTNNFSGTFEISPQNQTDFSGSQRLGQCTTNPIITLKDGNLTDQDNRQAEVVAPNHQFQFDQPLQDKRYYVNGFQVCVSPLGDEKNPKAPFMALAHGGNTSWYACHSGSFSNLYDTDIGSVCDLIYIFVLPCGDGMPNFSEISSTSTESSSSSTSAVSLTSSTTSAPTSMAPYTPSMPAVPASTPAAPSPSSVTAAAPYPTGNATTPAASGTGSPSSTAPGTSSSSPLSAPASGADTLAVGAKLGALVAAIAAFAML